MSGFLVEKDGVPLCRQKLSFEAAFNLVRAKAFSDGFDAHGHTYQVSSKGQAIWCLNVDLFVMLLALGESVEDDDWELVFNPNAT